MITDTAGNIQQVPSSKAERERIFAAVEEIAFDGPMTRGRLVEQARQIADEDFLAWTMVLIGSRSWRDQVRAVPYERRLLLLPHCMRNSRLCPAKCDRDGLLCESCGACELGNLKSRAEELGYHVMIAEGSPVVMQWILSGKADAILGVGCLRSLERAFDKLLLAGIPAMAYPLHASDCRDSETDLDRVVELLQTPYDPGAAGQGGREDDCPGRIVLLRTAAGLFTERFKDDANFVRTDESVAPIRWTERISLDFAARGGKYYRPFITLSVYDALTGSRIASADGPDAAAKIVATTLPNWVCDTARAVEVFHKASLIHDDIADEDDFRYGKRTLHAVYGTPAAINAGDYLIGYGYRLIAGLYGPLERSNCDRPGDIVSEMLLKLSEAHLRLCEGQGAELAWTNGASPDDDLDGNKRADVNRNPTPSDIIKVYVLKTSPAFEAAMEIGLLAAVAERAVDWDFYRRCKVPLARISRHLGVAFQIRNDLDDWLPDKLNKKVGGGDARHARPTMLRALSGLDAADFARMDVREIETFFVERGVFDKSRRLIEKYAAKAREAAQEIEHPDFRRLLLHFVETIAAV